MSHDDSARRDSALHAEVQKEQGDKAYRDGRVYSPRKYLSTTCSAGRDPKALAREVERRLLADYEPAYREALADVEASDSATTSAWVAAERIARIVGADLPAPHNRPNNCAALPLHLSSSHVHGLKVHPPYAEKPVLVSFDVHDVDEATALEMLALLARNQPDA